MSISKNQFKLITSLSQKKYRLKHKLFIAEGVKVVKEFLNSSFEVETLFCTDAFYSDFSNHKIIRISESDLQKISNLKTPNNVLGLFKIPDEKSLQKNGAKINSVGIQAHWQLTSPSLEEIETSILAFSELGVKVMFTELDISVLPSPWDQNGAEVSQNFKNFEGDKKMNPFPKNLPNAMKIKLAERYEDIFKLFLKHKEKISRVTFWGVTDKFSWLNDWPIKGRTNYPLLFDRNYKEKKAYQRIMNLNMPNN